MYDIAADELVIDNFAGGGGTSTGAEMALERPVDVAINHSPIAIAMHTANHPRTKHYVEDVWDVDPREVCRGRRVGLIWFSPDCRHFSKAKGGKPRSYAIRGLAWVAIRWAREVKPRVIILENVEEFQTWGPLDAEGCPIPERAGETFQMWLEQLRVLGYVVEYRTLVAADYGAPTTRKRFFLIARRDGAPIVWPTPTHGKGRAKPWRAAAEVIDWSIPAPSIFGRKKPLAHATLRRIAEGVRRYVLTSGAPFIAPVTHPRDARVHDIREPLRTVTGANRGELALVAPTLIQTGYGEREGQAPRVLDLHKPLGTIMATGQKHGLVTALLTKHYGGVVGHSPEATLGTVTARDHHALTTAFLTKFYGTSVGSSAADPAPTVTAGGNHLAEVRAFLVRHFGESVPDVVTIGGERYVIADIGMRMLQPHELFAAQGFPPDYVIDPVYEGKPLTKTHQIKLAGNSVPPHVACALIRANCRREGMEDAA